MMKKSRLHSLIKLLVRHFTIPRACCSAAIFLHILLLVEPPKKTKGRPPKRKVQDVNQFEAIINKRNKNKGIFIICYNFLIALKYVYIFLITFCQNYMFPALINSSDEDMIADAGDNAADGDEGYMITLI
jgi:hypothetical protein